MIFLYEKKINNRKGFVLLFAVVLSSIVLTLALGLQRVALKEIIFQTSTKSTSNAFFAADTGAECALYHDIGVSPSHFGADPFDINNPFIVECAGTALDISTPTGPWTFVLRPLGFSGDACAIVTVTKTGTTTQVISKGYSTGGQTTTCTATNPDRVEREIEVNY